jgi:hypothetical protein
MAYAYYVVNKETGRVVAGNEYREDANDAREDSPLPKSQTQVLTAAGVRRKYGKIVWERGTRRNARRSPLAHDRENLLLWSFDLFPDALEEAYPYDSDTPLLMDLLENASAIDYIIRDESGSIPLLFRAPSERDRPREKNEYAYSIEPTPSGRFQSNIARALSDKGFHVFIHAEWDEEDQKLHPIQMIAGKH